MVAPGDRRDLAAYLERTHQVSITRACKLLGLAKSMYYYKSVRDDGLVINKLKLLAEQKPTRGFWYYYGRIRNEGLIWNHKKVKRVYNLMKLNIRRKHKRRLPQRCKSALCQPANVNKTWSMDFMHDTLITGRKVRVLNIIDDFNREALVVKADYSHSGRSVVNALQEIIDFRGKPEEIRCDNGPEFLSNIVVEFCNVQGIYLKYIQPGKPTQNAFVERFNKTFREDILDAYLFESLRQLQDLSLEWMDQYNELHPHESLNYMSPLKYLTKNNQL